MSTISVLKKKLGGCIKNQDPSPFCCLQEICVAIGRVKNMRKIPPIQQQNKTNKNKTKTRHFRISRPLIYVTAYFL